MRGFPAEAGTANSKSSKDQPGADGLDQIAEPDVAEAVLAATDPGGDAGTGTRILKFAVGDRDGDRGLRLAAVVRVNA